ncbi:MAG: hypothetical protein R3F45_07310 [Gammaproteobacteria bacterium]
MPGDVEALAVVTPTPIAAMDPDGQVQKLLGDRIDDIVAFRRGDIDGVLHPKSSGATPIPCSRPPRSGRSPSSRSRPRLYRR